MNYVEAFICIGFGICFGYMLAECVQSIQRKRASRAAISKASNQG